MALWDKITSRGRVEDRRGFAPVVGGISLTGLALILIVNTLLGGNPTDVLTQLQDIPIENGQQQHQTGDFKGSDDYEIFASTVLGSADDMWRKIFSRQGKNYKSPTLVLFRQSTESGCGVASALVGPHYCPADKTIYLDETFFEELTNRYGAKGGDVAEAYVIAHEVGHHAQNELGILNNEAGVEEQNDISVKKELQADCFAGLWANSIKDQNVFVPGEIDEAMDAAAAVGDDRIQETVTGRITPENWTHGSSEQRVKWFNTGFETGSFAECMAF
jgi:predicted metalloprotease